MSLTIFDSIYTRHIDLRRQVSCAAYQLEAVQELRGSEAAQLELVVDLRTGTTLFHRHAGDEQQGLVEVG